MTHDSLTNLLTRSGLLDGLGRIESHRPRAGTHVGVLYVDLDNFKQTNDHLGHAAGDAVLIHVAERIRRCARGDDLVARLGGDEIVVVLPDVHGSADAEAVAAKIRNSLQPIAIDGTSVRPTLSIGVAVAGPGELARDVIDRADRALYRAKRSGRDRIATCDPALDSEHGDPPS